MLRRPAVVEVHVDPGEFTIPRGRILLDVSTTAERPTVLAAAQGVASSRRSIARRAGNHGDWFLSVGAGSYRWYVGATGGGVSPFRLDVSLVGDVNGDARVDGSDLVAVRDGIGRRDPRLDVNHDNRVDLNDYRLTRSNLGASTTVRPLDVTAALDPSAPVNSDGLLLDANAVLVGRTSPGATVRVDAGGDGTSDRVVTADAAGLYRVTLAVGSGQTPVVVSASDSFGQRAEARLILRRAEQLDKVPPAFTAFGLAAEHDDGTLGDGRTTLGVVSLTGRTEPGLIVTLVETGAAVRSDAQGSFRFDGVALAVGATTFHVTAADDSGNVGGAALTVTRTAASAANEVILAWNQAALKAVRSDASSPPVATRSLAIVHAAIYDAVSALAGERGVFVTLSAPAGASPEAAAAGAAHAVLLALYPSQAATLDAFLDNTLVRIPAGASREAGLEIGGRIAAAILALRANDGSSTYLTDEGSASPGLWRPTAPAFATGLAPQWATVTPFLMDSPSQFRPGGPPSLDSDEFAEAVTTVRALGAIDSTARTSEQTQIARFWADGAGTITPPGHWNQIAQAVIRERGFGLRETARVFAMLDLALADAAIACWDTKYAYDFWRPVTVIREGDAALAADPSWTPLIATPPFPEYVSGHSTFSAAAATVLSALFGPDAAFSIGSPGLPGVVRNYGSFDEAAAEAGLSRIYGGIHFPFSNSDGSAMGRSVGELAVSAFAGGANDARGPVVTITAPAEDAVLGGAADVRGRVNDLGSGVASLAAVIDGGVPLAVAFDPVTGDFRLPLSGLGDGVHQAEFTPVDARGNGSTLTLNFTIDSAAPVVSVTTLVDGDAIDGLSVLGGTADGTGSTLVGLSYAIDGGESIPVAFDAATGEFATALALGKVVPGPHQITIAATDAAGTTARTLIDVTLPTAIPFTIASVSPDDGAIDVGPTFRPKVVFSRPVDPATLNASTLSLGFGGLTLPATIAPSADGTFAWIFPRQPLPGGSQVTLTIDGAGIRATDGSLLDAAGDGVAGSLRAVRFTTTSLAELPGTTLVGVVADPGPDLKPMTADDVTAGPDGVLNTADDVYLRPIAGVTVYVLGREDRKVVTDAAGRFTLDGVPAGDVKLAVDGLTATSAPSGYYFPEMIMALDVAHGRSQTVMGTMVDFAHADALSEVRGVYLARLRTSILQTVDNAQGLSTGIDAGAAPDLTPQQRVLLRFEVAPNSLIGPDGRPLASAQIGVSTVPTDLVRDMLPPGVTQLATTLTLQAPGVAAFATPVRLTVPNVYGAAPGSKLNFYSFNHTTGRLEITGTATVSADGASVVSDPDGGIPFPGWFGVVPGSPCEPCEQPDADGGGDTGGGVGPLSVVALAAPDDEIEPRHPFGAQGLENKLFGRDGDKVTVKLVNKLPKNTKNRDDALIVVEVTADGPYKRFLTGSAITSLIGKHEICPGTYTYEFKAKELLDELRKLAPADQLDQLFATTFKLVAYCKTKPDVILARKSFTLGRFVGMVDPGTWQNPKVDNFNAAFLKTLIGGDGRVKQVKYDVATNTPISLALGGDDAGAFSLGTSSLRGSGTTNWRFTPEQKGQSLVSGYIARVDLTVKSKPVGAITPFGGGIMPSTLAPNAAQVAAFFKDYLSNPLTRNTFRPSAAFDTLYSKYYSNFGLGQSDEIKAEIEFVAAELGQDVYDAFQVDLAFLEDAGAVSFATDGGDVNVIFASDVRDGTNRPRYGADPTADVNFAALTRVLDDPSVPVAAREFVFTNALNNTVRGDGFLVSFSKHAEFTGATTLGIHIADTIVHEMGHTFGLLDSYNRKTLQNAYAPADLMIAGFTGRGDMHFDPSTNQMVMKAATGVAPNKPGALENAMKVYRANGNFGLQGESHLDEELASVPGLAVELADGLPIGGDGLDLGVVLADGPGGARALLPLRITNAGSAPTSITSVTFGVAGFGLGDSSIVGRTLASGESVSVELVFDPAAGASADVSGTLAIAYADAPNGAFTLPIRARGLTTAGQLALDLLTDPSDNLTPQNNLGGARIGGAPVVVNGFATLTNVGGGPLTVSRVEIAGGSGSFAVSALPDGFGPGRPIVLAPGESFSFDLSYQPDASGLQRGQIRVVSDDPSRPEALQTVVGTGLPAAGTAFQARENYIAMTSSDTEVGPVFRLRTDARGFYRFVVPGRTGFAITGFDPASGLVATGGGVSEPNGVMTMVNPLLYVASTSPDRDGDGLPDDVEFAVGTSPARADTNGDGVDDFAAIAGGLDPTAAGAFPTGVVASLSTGDRAREVVVVATPGPQGGQTAFVADTDGLTIVDVTRFDRPARLARIALLGFGTSVAMDEREGLAVVAAGQVGVHVVDISDLTAPTLLRTVPLDATVVRIVDGIAFAAGGSELTAFDPRTGVVLSQRSYPGGTIDDVAVSQGYLYTINSQRSTHTVHKIAAVDELEVPAASLLVEGHPTFGRMHIFADSGLIYVGGADNNIAEQIPGVEILRDEGTRLVLVGPPSGVTAFDVTTNGSGLALFAGATPRLESDADVALLDVNDPTRTDRFLGSFPVPGTAVDLVVASGIAYVAADASGLHVVNYLEFDAKGRAPTVTIASSAADLDPDAPGLQINQGGNLPVFVAAADDVQVARVELLVNGVAVAADVSAPFEFFATAPLSESSASVQVRATDTGGNVGLSNILNFSLIPDVTPPALLRSNPTDGGEVATASGIVLRFDEPIDTTIVGMAGISLSRDGVPVALRSVSAPSSRGITIATPASLPFGRYVLTLDPSIVADRVGNHIAAPLTVGFTVGHAQVIAASPAPGSTVAAPIGSLTLDFNTEVNAASPQPADFALRETGPDGTFDTSDDVIVTVASLAFNAAGDRLTLTPASPLGPGRYRVTAPAARLLDRYGRPLDGEFRGAFPTGDGLAGGDFATEFNVAAPGAFDFDAFPVHTYPNFDPSAIPGLTLDFTGVPSVTADLNGDGHLDVLRTIHGRYFAGFSGGQQVYNPVDRLVVVYGQPGGGFSEPSAFHVAPGASRVAVGDLNGDAVLDVVVLGNPGDVNTYLPFQLSVLIGNGNGFLPERRIDTGLSGNEACDMLLQDLDGDGKLDLAMLATKRRYTPQGQPTAPNRLVVFTGNGDRTFGVPSVVDLGNDDPEHQLLAGDLNGDGRLDLVSTRHILINGGGGVFTPTPLSAGSTLLALADLDGDGRSDLLSSSSITEIDPDTGKFAVDELEVLTSRGLGDGTFGTPARVRAPVSGDYGGNSFTAFPNVVLHDLDGDGHLDLVLAGTESFADPRGSVAILRGHGDGTFTLAGVLPVWTRENRHVPIAVGVGDASGDGKADLILGLPPVGVSLLRTAVITGNGDGTFQTPLLSTRLAFGDQPPLYNGRRRLADLDGDGHLDLLRLLDPQSSDPIALQFARGLGDGTFAPYVVVAEFPRNSDGGGGVGAAVISLASVTVPDDFLLADVDRDGHLDAVVWNTFGAFDARILRGRGDGTLAAAAPLLDEEFGVLDLALVDVNNDGAPDLVRISGGVGLAVKINDGQGAFGPDVLSSYAQSGVFRGSLAFADLNGDGKLDIVNADNGVALGAGNGSFFRTARPFLGVGTAPHVAADLDGDGKLDLISPTGKGIYINIGNGDGTVSDGQVRDLTAVTPYALTAADLDGDGDADLVLSCNEEVVLLLNDGRGVFQAPQRFLAPGLAYNTPRVEAIVADLDRDGLLDIIAGDAVLLRRRS